MNLSIIRVKIGGPGPSHYWGILLARLPRIVVPGLAYLVTQRGNRESDVFVTPEDRAHYRDVLASYAGRYGLDLWAYCLMPNHVHLLAFAREAEALSRAVGRAHMRYAQHLNARNGWRGHLWADRFLSTALDEAHVIPAACYVELSPVRAGLAETATDYPWSSARANAGLAEDQLLSNPRPVPGADRDWIATLAKGLDPELMERLRRNTVTGRPTGDEAFLGRLERHLMRSVRPQKRGPKKHTAPPAGT